MKKYIPPESSDEDELVNNSVLICKILQFFGLWLYDEKYTNLKIQPNNWSNYCSYQYIIISIRICLIRISWYRTKKGSQKFSFKYLWKSWSYSHALWKFLPLLFLYENNTLHASVKPKLLNFSKASRPRSTNHFEEGSLF